jgi:hypothetical protein
VGHVNQAGKRAGKTERAIRQLLKQDGFVKDGMDYFLVFGAQWIDLHSQVVGYGN